jgi:hypothetical protein
MTVQTADGAAKQLKKPGAQAEISNEVLGSSRGNGEKHPKVDSLNLLLIMSGLYRGSHGNYLHS